MRIRDSVNVTSFADVVPGAAEWIAWGLDHPPERRSTGYCFDGIANAAREVAEALGSVYGD